MGAVNEADLYSGISGPSSFGPGGDFITGGLGNAVGVNGNDNILFVPFGYSSGTPLGVSTATWSGFTFAFMGVTPGTYVWTWGEGIHADSFTLQIGPANGVPDSGSTIALMLGAMGTLIAFRQLLVRS